MQHYTVLTVKYHTNASTVTQLLLFSVFDKEAFSGVIPHWVEFTEREPLTITTEYLAQQKSYQFLLHEAVLARY